MGFLEWLYKKFCSWGLHDISEKTQYSVNKIIITETCKRCGATWKNEQIWLPKEHQSGGDYDEQFG